MEHAKTVRESGAAMLHDMTDDVRENDECRAESRRCAQVSDR